MLYFFFKNKFLFSSLFSTVVSGFSIRIFLNFNFELQILKIFKCELGGVPIIIRSNLTSHIQEAHITILHYLCEELESY